MQKNKRKRIIPNNQKRAKKEPENKLKMERNENGTKIAKE